MPSAMAPPRVRLPPPPIAAASGLAAIIGGGGAGAWLAGFINFDQCLNVGLPITDAERIQVFYNGILLKPVPAGSATDGFSWVTDSPEICLEGGLVKKVDDRFEVFLLEN